MNKLVPNDILNNLKIIVKSPQHDAFFEWLAGRERDSQYTKIARAAEKSGVAYREAVAIFRDLENAAIGKLIVGRKGHQSRFEWGYSLVAVGKAALGEIVSDFDIDFDNIDSNDDDADIDFITHRYILRKDKEIVFNLPFDLSPNEAERIANFIKTLPMN
jgi:hypothetical protein